MKFLWVVSPPSQERGTKKYFMLHSKRIQNLKLIHSKASFLFAFDFPEFCRVFPIFSKKKSGPKSVKSTIWPLRNFLIGPSNGTLLASNKRRIIEISLFAAKKSQKKLSKTGFEYWIFRIFSNQYLTKSIKSKIGRMG